MSPSFLGMIENGARLPTEDALEELAIKLGLTGFQRLQLKAVAGYSGQLQEARGSEIRPSDLIEGTPLFLRKMETESEFQDKLVLEEVWIVTRRPMSMEGPYLKWLRGKLLNSDCIYTYFVDARFGESDFATLWDRLDLESDPEWRKKVELRHQTNMQEQLRFVLCPPALSAANHTVALFNPRSLTLPKFGRVGYYDNGIPIGVHGIDRSLYDQVVTLIKEFIADCEKYPNQPFPRDPSIHGTYKLITLPRRHIDTNEARAERAK